MKKNILYIGLVALALQSCDYLDREPLDPSLKTNSFQQPALMDYSNIVTISILN